MNKGKVVLVPFPFDDLSSAKVRPAIVLTEPIGEYHQVILGFITSQIPEELLSSDILIETTDPDFEASGLRFTSALRLHRLMTVATSFLERELGELSPALQAQVQEKLKILFDL